MRDRLGLGQPTENPFFADIYIPSDRDLSDTSLPPLPVRVFIHGGFLQFGSTSGQHYNQQFFSSEHFNEIRVLLGHRVSVLGFLGCDEPKVSGNFGFKDCWLGLEWVRDNIAAFGGECTVELRAQALMLVVSRPRAGPPERAEWRRSCGAPAASPSRPAGTEQGESGVTPITYLHLADDHRHPSSPQHSCQMPS
jgi:hypothetical protein